MHQGALKGNWATEKWLAYRTLVDMSERRGKSNRENGAHGRRFEGHDAISGWVEVEEEYEDADADASWTLTSQ